MHSIPTRFLRGLAMVLLGVLSSTTASAQQTLVPAPEPNGWRTVVYPIHAWLPVFGAEVRLPEQPGPPGSGGIIPEAETSGNFDGAALAGFRIERSRVSAQAEFLWAGMSGSIELPRFRLGLDTASIKMLAGFRVAPALYVDAGVRYFALKMTASILDFPTETWEPSIWEPVIGVTFRPQLSRSVRIMAQADAGGIGADSHRTTAAKGLIEWKPLAHLTVGAGYGFLYLRADGTLRSKPVHFNQTLHGPILTIGIPF